MNTPSIRKTKFSADFANQITKRFVIELSVFLSLIILPFAFAFCRDFPYLYEDEYGVLGAAAVLSGFEWRAPSMPYYGFLAAIITAPIHALDLDPTWTYRLTLSTNALLLSASGLLTFRIVRMLTVVEESRLAVLVVIAAYTWPATLYFSSLALGESVLLFTFTAIAYLLVRLLLLPPSLPINFDSILLGFCLGAVPFAHSRGIAFLLAGCAALSLAAWGRKISTRVLISTLLCLTVSYSALDIIKFWLISDFYTDISKPTTSILKFVKSVGANLDSGDAFARICRVVFGQAFYLVSSTYGMWLLGVVTLIHSCQRFVVSIPFTRNKRALAFGSAQDYVLFFLLISLALVFLASVLQMSMPERTDQYFYGRYNEVLVPAVLTVLLILMSRSRKVYLFYGTLGSLCAVLVMGLVVTTYPDDIFDLKIIYAQVSGWFIHQYGIWKINPVTITLSVAACQIALGLVLLGSKRFFLLALISMNVCVSCYLFVNRHMKVDHGWQEFVGLENRLDGALDGASIRVIGGRSKIDVALQFALPHSRVIYDNEATLATDAVLDYSGEICSRENAIASLEGGNICLLRF